MSRPVDAISALVDFLDVFPTDAEAWCELADLYQAQGMSMQAIFCLEEALLVAPNAWNVRHCLLNCEINEELVAGGQKLIFSLQLHARLGEVEYISSTSSDNQEMTVRLLADSVRRFCRSIELCDDYLRGYYGLKLVRIPFILPWTLFRMVPAVLTHSRQSTSRLLDKLSTKAATQLKGGDHNLPTQETLTKLQALSTKKLHEIVHSRSADIRCREMNQSELIAAQELLDREGK